MKLSGDLNSLLLKLVLTSVFVTAAESQLEQELPATCLSGMLRGRTLSPGTVALT